MSISASLLDGLQKLVASAAAVRRGHGLAILTFHRVSAEPDPLFPLEPDSLRFDRMVAMLKRSFRLQTLSGGADAMRRGALDRPTLVLTFDDGYRDNADVALPILVRHGVPATFFICTGYLQGQTMWNDRVIDAVRSSTRKHIDLAVPGLGRFDLSDIPSRRHAIDTILQAIKPAEPTRREQLVDAVEQAAGKRRRSPGPMMTPVHVRRLADAGMEIGAHTVNHPILTSIPIEQARGEFGRNRQELQDLTGQAVDVLAYPNGRPRRDYDLSHVQLARELGFRWAVSTAPGWASAANDPLQLPRLAPWGRSLWDWSYRLWQPAFTARPAART